MSAGEIGQQKESSETLSRAVTDAEHVLSQQGKTYDVVRRQATLGFIIASVVAVLGVFVILAGVVGDVFGLTEGGNLRIAAGIVVEVVSGIGMYLYNQASKRLDATSKELHESWKVLTALKQVELLPSSRRGDVLVALIAKLADADLQTSRNEADSRFSDWLIPYDRWKTLHARLNKLFHGDDESYAIREVLWCIVSPYPEKHKLENPKIDNFFISYPRPKNKRGMIKLQRIRGQATNHTTDVYYVAETSLPGQVSSCMFCMNAGAILPIAAEGTQKETWVPLSYPLIDCLLVAHYEEGVPGEGDWLWVDVPKYTVNSAHVSIVILSERPLDDKEEARSVLWEVHRNDQTNVPAGFARKADGAMIDLRKRIVEEMKEMEEWLAKLHELAHDTSSDDGRQTAKAFLLQLEKKLGQALSSGDLCCQPCFLPSYCPICLISLVTARIPL